MGSVKVTVFGRIKPRQKGAPSQDYKLKYGDHEDQITFAASKASTKKVFRFKKIFGEDATQKQIFEAVAKPVIKNVFEGYNGTIFTYGQTGSGKTHTMTGSLEDWVDTGLIPRTVQEIFQMKDSDTVISITYFEIYNEHVYDLIRSDRVDSDATQDSMDETSTITNFRNLSVHIVRSACEALLLYRRGDANKMIAETSSNSRSSRSHVIFSIGFEFPHPKEEMLSLKPVLYLVDLAGSERITKCKTPMANPWETRYINLSLHYLEQVLVALRQPGRAHIPYRNSLMTALLRNSLGGNCITAMVATFSLSVHDIEETTQTCRFAERIALIKNEVKLSELTTPQKEIDSLKKENERLKNQLKLISNEQVQEQLTDKDKEKCNEMVQNFLRDSDFFSLPLTDVRRMEFCFYLMRNEIVKKKKCGMVKSKIKPTTDALTMIDNTVWSMQKELKCDDEIDEIGDIDVVDVVDVVEISAENDDGDCDDDKDDDVEEDDDDKDDDNKDDNKDDDDDDDDEDYGDADDGGSGVDVDVDDADNVDDEDDDDVGDDVGDDDCGVLADSDLKNIYSGVHNNSKAEKKPWRKRNPLELPKVNITYKKWKSTEHLEEKGTSSSAQKSNTKAAQPKIACSSQESKKNETLLPKPGSEYREMTAQCLQEKNYGITRPRHSNFALKFSGESKQDNINYSNVSSWNNSENPGVVSKGKAISKKRFSPECFDTHIPNTVDYVNKSQSSENEKKSNDEKLHGKDRFPAICVPLTGDEEVDEEIIRFYESRYQLFKDK